jgi:glycosyltransferase involved in cell wall biosynthesis
MLNASLPVSREYDVSSVSVVVLARNEERSIADVVKAALPFCKEVVVMDGRSTDETAVEAARAGARVIHDPGLGKGAAIRESIAVCDSEFLVFIDADGSHDAADIPALVGALVSGEADLCVGSRFAGGSDELSVSMGQLVRTIGNILMNIAINNRWNVELTDTLNGYRAVRRQSAIAVALTEDTHTIEQEMVMKFLRNGYNVVNVPTHEYCRQYGESHIHIWREWPKFVWCVVKNVVARDVQRGQQRLASPSYHTDSRR